MKHELPVLSYGMKALEPFISAETLEYHHGKHHLAYVNNLNNLIPGTAFESATLEEMILKAEGPVFNNAAQVWNHTFYFEQFSASVSHQPSGALLSAIEKSFGTFDQFKDEFTKASVSLFGSGWTWLCPDTTGKLVIMQESNAGNPLRKGLKPILTCDVWEHAYYIDTRNARPKYIENFWQVLDWKIIEKRFEQI